MGLVTPSTPYFVILSYVPKICSLSMSLITDMNSQQIRRLKIKTSHHSNAGGNLLSIARYEGLTVVVHARTHK